MSNKTKRTKHCLEVSKTQEKPAKGQSGAFFTVSEIADMLRVEPLTIYRYIRSKKLIAYKLGKDYRVQEKDFKTFLNNCKTVK